MAQLIRDRDLTPYWGLKRATEPGFQRSLTTWVGGPKGYVNSNLGASAISQRCAAGLMRMKVGNRQPGVHVHSITEIYVILKGEVESFDGVGRTHRAGIMDCLYIPAGVPHGVRAVGEEDLELIWIHDGIERFDVSVYLEGEGPFPAEREVELVRFEDLRAGTAVAGSVCWVAGPAGMANHNPELAVPNDHVGVGLSLLPPGSRQAPLGHKGASLFVALNGRGVARIGGGPADVGPLDAVYTPLPDPAITNTADTPLAMLWVAETVG